MQEVLRVLELMPDLIRKMATALVEDTQRVVALERAGRLGEAGAIALPWITAIEKSRDAPRH